MIGLVGDPRDVLRRRASPPDVVVAYGPGADQVADVRLPAAPDAPATLVVLLHGGFWRSVYDRVHTRPMADGLVDAGYAVVMPEYARTGDGGGWPATFDDVALALGRLPRLAADLGVDADHVVLVGHSAGGQLALWCAARGLPGPYLGVVALAPVADLAEAHRLDLDGGAVAALLGGGPDDLPDRYDAADPCRLPPPELPVVVVHGSADVEVPTDLSERYAAHAGAGLRILPGVEHFGLIDPRAPAWPAVLGAVQFVQEGRSPAL
ncbi:MAG: alpha/beta hydrolase [Jiangellaceae bacterium]